MEPGLSFIVWYIPTVVVSELIMNLHLIEEGFYIEEKNFHSPRGTTCLYKYMYTVSYVYATQMGESDHVLQDLV